MNGFANDKLKETAIFERSRNSPITRLAMSVSPKNEEPKEMGSTSLWRYTNLAAVIHLLESRQITLLNPSTWDDSNDAFFMSVYKERKKASSVLALCFAESPQTYHHWRVFSHGTDGVCIEFDKFRLLKSLDADGGVKHGSINYARLRDVRRMTDIATEELPYVKRWPYKDEAEYRAVYVDHVDPKPFHDVPIPLNSINRITLSPWLATSLADSVKSHLKSKTGCSKLKIYRSTLIDNPNWKRRARSRHRRCSAALDA